MTEGGRAKAPRHRRQVLFEDIDAAGIVFFARFYGYCHEAIVPLFDGYPGGYVGLIRKGLGFPVVHCDADYTAPLRFGDAVDIDPAVEALGRSKLTFLSTVYRVHDGAPSAVVRHTCVLTDLAAMKSVPLPDELRAALQRYKL